MTSISELELLDEANFALYRGMTLRSGGRVVEHDGLTLVIGLHSSPVVVNSIFRSRPGRIWCLGSDKRLNPGSPKRGTLGRSRNSSRRVHGSEQTATARLIGENS